MRILTAIKQQWGKRVTTVFVKQGHYANDPKVLAAYPSADICLDHIGDVLNYEMDTLLDAGTKVLIDEAKNRSAHEH